VSISRRGVVLVAAAVLLVSGAAIGVTEFSHRAAAARVDVALASFEESKATLRNYVNQANATLAALPAADDVGYPDAKPKVMAALAEQSAQAEAAALVAKHDVETLETGSTGSELSKCTTAYADYLSAYIDFVHPLAEGAATSGATRVHATWEIARGECEHVAVNDSQSRRMSLFLAADA